MKIKQNIPNFLTCCNLLCGCLAIVCAFEGNLVWAAYLVGIAAVFDFFDGFAARMLGVSSPIGKDLDSLADMVTFGVVPGVVVFKIFLFSADANSIRYIHAGWHTTINYLNIIPYIAFMIPIFSAIRLAKFNNDARQSDSFIGVPTPANAVFFCSIPLLFPRMSYKPVLESNLLTVQEKMASGLISNHYLLIALVVLFSFLLVSELPLFALKFKSFGWKGNEIRYAFLGLSLVLIVTLKFLGIPLVIILYILLSVINNLFFKAKSPIEGV